MENRSILIWDLLVGNGGSDCSQTIDQGSKGSSIFLWMGRGGIRYFCSTKDHSSVLEPPRAMGGVKYVR